MITLACTFQGQSPKLSWHPLSGLHFFSLGPSFKRGPPKGYINAIEQRLHQVEAIFGVLVSSRDERTQSVINDLRKDPMASEIISRVDVGPYGSDRRTPSTDVSDNTRDKGDGKGDQRLGGSRDSRLDREIVSSSHGPLTLSNFCQISLRCL